MKCSVYIIYSILLPNRLVFVTMRRWQCTACAQIAAAVGLRVTKDKRTPGFKAEFLSSGVVRVKKSRCVKLQKAVVHKIYIDYKAYEIFCEYILSRMLLPLSMPAAATFVAAVFVARGRQEHEGKGDLGAAYLNSFS